MAYLRHRRNRALNAVAASRRHRLRLNARSIASERQRLDAPEPVIALLRGFLSSAVVGWRDKPI